MLSFSAPYFACAGLFLISRADSKVSLFGRDTGSLNGLYGLISMRRMSYNFNNTKKRVTE